MPQDFLHLPRPAVRFLRPRAAAAFPALLAVLVQSVEELPLSSTTKEAGLIILGVVLILIGALANIGILYTLGAILAVVGVVLWILGAMGNAVGGRRHYY